MEGSSRTRLARGFALEFDNFDERRKFEESVGHGSLARQRIDEMVGLADRLGLTTPAADGRPRLRVTAAPYIDVLRSLPPAERGAPDPQGDVWVYRFLSGYAHAKAWAVMLGLQDVESQSGGGVVGRVEAVETYTVEMVERVWRHVEAAVAQIERLWRGSPP